MTCDLLDHLHRHHGCVGGAIVASDAGAAAWCSLVCLVWQSREHCHPQQSQEVSPKAQAQRLGAHVLAPCKHRWVNGGTEGLVAATKPQLP